MVKILMMAANLATPALVKIKVYRKNGYDVLLHDYEVTNKILSCDSNYVADVVM